MRVIAFALAIFTATPAAASILACGLKPFPPIGCSSSDARCVCDSNGNCQWVWLCD